ncbi:MAG: thermonuclease family protein [Proteobacteria bacterium]|nr:thermonuclease family protein [Pseudomonadota bacterium]
MRFCITSIKNKRLNPIILESLTPFSQLMRLKDRVRGNIIVTGFLFLLLCSGSYDAECSGLYEVRWVDDGDTIVLTDGKRVRYTGINSPEVESEYSKAEPFGYEAREFNRRLVYLKKVRLEFDIEKYDQYGRLLAYVFLPDGTFINNAMITAGYAYCLPKKPNVKYEDLFLKSQQNAMLSNIGIWQNLNDETGEYTGNNRSKRFHLKSCPFARKIDKNSIKIYKGKRDAYRDGYAPCKKCLNENSRGD